MADRALQLSLACEKYSDGSAYTIAYSEERSNPELLEQNSPEGSGCTRTFYCAWEDRFYFQENVCGFAKINEAGKDGVSADGFGVPGVTSYDGRHVHRKLPMGYHNGFLFLRGAVLPAAQDWLYAVRSFCSPNAVKGSEIAGVTMGKYNPRADYAKITVVFASLDYDLYSDIEVYNGGGSAGVAVGCCREWLRYAKIVQKPALQYFHPPGSYLKLTGYPASGQEGVGALGSIDSNQQVNLLDNIADFWVYIYDLPYDPIAAINLCFGRVNSTAIFPTPDFSAGQPAETLLLCSADITRLPLKLGRRYWNVQLGFRKVYNIDNSPTGAGATVGHNYLRWPVKDGANPNILRSRFFRACSDPANPTATGSAMIDLVDFRKLFWIPSTCLQPPVLPVGP